MKKKSIVFIILIVSMLIFSSTTVFATDYKVFGTDLTVNIDDSIWYVFTRDNIENNAELNDIGISYEKMYDILYDNMVYMDALLLYENNSFIEFFIRKTNVEDIVNLSNYDDDDILLLAEKFASKVGSEKYDIYESQYKFIRLDYIDFSTDTSTYMCEYITVINGENYTLTFQSNEKFVDSEYKEINSIIDSIEFEIDTSLIEKNHSTSIFDGLLEKFMVGGVVSLIMLGFSWFISKLKNDKIDINDTSIKKSPKIKKAVSKEKKDETGNYGYINSFFKSDIDNIKHQVKSQVISTVDKYNLIYKTDLIKIVFGDISQNFENNENTNVDMIICSYYQIALDSIIMENDDMNDFMFAYAITKMNDSTKNELNSYLKLLVKIQSIIDEVIKYCYSSKSTKGEYAKVLKKHIFNELNNYIDD